MFPTARRTLKTFSPGEPAAAPASVPRTPPRWDAHLAAQRPRQMEEYPNDVATAMTESHATFSRLGSCERSSWNAPNTTMYLTPVAPPPPPPPSPSPAANQLRWKRFTLRTALHRKKKTSSLADQYQYTDQLQYSSLYVLAFFHLISILSF